MMRNGFLLIRCVFFALLSFLSLLTLAFAAWNINSLLKADQDASTTSGLIIFEGVCFFLGAAMAFLEAIRPKANTAGIALECGWVAALALFQLGTSISSTINASVYSCRASSSADICASTFMLVPTMWLKALLSFGYFFCLFITALAHRGVCENIWSQTVYSMAWFEESIDSAISRVDRDLETAKAKKKCRDWDAESIDDEDPYTRFFSEIDSSSARKKAFAEKEANETAPWAQQTPNIRRGVDQPFSNVTSPATVASTGLPPVVPEKAAATGGAAGLQKSNTVSSRFIERFRESRLLSRFELPSLYGTHFMNNGNPPFPDPLSPTSNQDVDKPIPLGRMSQWVRADEHRR